MDLIKELIISINEAGLRTEMYSTINSVAFYLSIILGILHGIKLKVKAIPVILSVLLERYSAGYLASAVIYVENGFVNTGKKNAVVAFVFAPLIGYIVSKLLKKSYKEIWDVVMVSPLVMFAGARIACTIAGCCRGYSCSWGIYNVKVDENVFPIQLLESLVTILILVFVFCREKKNNFVPDGKNVPIILISYGVLRFFLEFLHDNEKIVLGLASTQFHCVLMILVGVITLLIIRKSEKTEAPTPISEAN